MKKHQRSMLSLQLQGKQMLALLLSAIFLFASLPIAAIAEDGLPQEEGGAPQIYDDVASAETAEGEVMEVESLREANVKHFYMGDGTYRAVSYGTEVHRKDAEGVWQEIDNTLTLQNGYHTTPDGRVKLASGSTANGYLLQLAENGYGIDMAMLPPSEPAGDMSMDMNANATLHTGSVTIQNAQREAVLETDSAEVKYQKLSKTLNHSKLTYANLSAGLDVSYELSGNKITEKIVVKGVRESYEFAFRLSLTGLTATLDEENIITFSDAETGEAVYTMPAPAMTDLVSGTTHAAAYELMALDEESYLLIVSADAELANEILTADATATLIGSENGGIELYAVLDYAYEYAISDSGAEYTYIRQSSGNDICSLDGGLYVDDDAISYLRLPLPELDDQATILSGDINIYIEGEDYLQMGAYQVNVPWQRDTWTWNMAASKTNMGISTTLLSSQYVEYSQMYEISLGELIIDWYIGVPNYGIALKDLSNDAHYACLYPTMGDDEIFLEVEYYHEGYSPIANGVYMLENGLFKQFLTPSVQNSVGSEMELEAIAPDPYLMWEIEYLHNNYYRITNVGSGYVLTAESNTSSPNYEKITQQALQPSSIKQQWRLTRVSPYGTDLTKGFKIESRTKAAGQNTHSKCMAVYLDDTLTKVIYQVSYTDNTTLDDVWRIHAFNGAVEAQAIFDESYTERYGGDDPEYQIHFTRGRILQHMAYLQREYLDRFGIIVMYTVANDDFACYACGSCGECKYAEGTDPIKEDCVGYVWSEDLKYVHPNQEEACHSSHHTNARSIGYDIRNSLSPMVNIITIAFIGHNVCSAGDSHKVDTPAGIAYPKQFGTPLTITIHNRKKLEEGGEDEHGEPTYREIGEYDSCQPADLAVDHLEYERSTVLHEFGHIFFVQDHYSSSNTTDELNAKDYFILGKDEEYRITVTNVGKGNYYDDCIYGYKRSKAVAQGNVICVGCQRMILAHINDYMYVYNQDTASE